VRVHLATDVNPVFNVIVERDHSSAAGAEAAAQLSAEVEPEVAET
jgi:hypothetical protein